MSTQTERTQRYLDNQRARGSVRVTVQCPVDRVQELKRLVAGWRVEALKDD